MKDGHVLVMSSGVDGSRLTLLLDSLTAQGLPVVVGPNVGGYPSAVQESDAAVLLLAFGGQGRPSELPYPVNEFARRGQLVVVNLDTSPHARASASDLEYIDLSDWPAVSSPNFDHLIGYLRALVDSGLHRHIGSPLDGWRIESAKSGVIELQTLTAKIGRLAEVLGDDAEQSQALRETLAEISGTYRVVKTAVEQFVAAGLQTGGPDAAVYAELAHGVLAQSIRNGRGHCTRIGVRYERVGGLRDTIKGKLSPETLAELDETFARLATADGDVFSAMDELGVALTNESRVILRYLLTGRTEQARQHIALTAEQLLPLEKALDEALAAFQEIELVLGYAEPVPQEKEVVHVTNQNITIHGNVVNSNVVVAKTIENSSIRVTESPIREDLKSVLLDLHKATAALTIRLPDDEASLAARDLEDLAKEATSPKPRPAFWRRAADGLVAAAKKTAEAGIPVIELVAKVTALFG